MTGRSCAIPAEREAPDVANAGLVRPPFVYLAAILVGSALQIAWPLHFLPPGIAPLGPVLIAGAAALFITSVRQFRAAGTPVPGDSPSTAVVEGGPLSLQPDPDLRGVLAAAARDRDVGRQRLAARDARRRRHGPRRHPARGTLHGAHVRRPLPRLQATCPSLGVTRSRPWTTGWPAVVRARQPR